MSDRGQPVDTEALDEASRQEVRDRQAKENARLAEIRARRNDPKPRG